MDNTWQVELNADLTVTTDGTVCHIGGVVSLTFEIADVELVWSELPTATVEPVGQLNLRLKDRSGPLASIRLSREQAYQIRALLEAGPGSTLH